MQVSLFFTLLLLMVSCMTPSEKVRLQHDVVDLQKRLTELEKDKKTLKSSYKDFDKDQRRSLAGLVLKVSELEKVQQQLQGEVQSLEIGVVEGELPGQKQRSMPNGEEEDATPEQLSIKERIEGLEDKIDTILNTLAGSEKKEEKGFQNFKDLQDAYKKRKYTEILNAESWIRNLKSLNDKKEGFFYLGESYYRKDQIQSAAVVFDELVQMKPPVWQARHAKLRLGDCFRRLGDKKTAKLYYGEVWDKYPKSNEARLAQKRANL